MSFNIYLAGTTPMLGRPCHKYPLNMPASLVPLEHGNSYDGRLDMSNAYQTFKRTFDGALASSEKHGALPSDAETMPNVMLLGEMIIESIPTGTPVGTNYFRFGYNDLNNDFRGIQLNINDGYLTLENWVTPAEFKVGDRVGLYFDLNTYQHGVTINSTDALGDPVIEILGLSPLITQGGISYLYAEMIEDANSALGSDLQITFAMDGDDTALDYPAALVYPASTKDNCGEDLVMAVLPAPWDTVYPAGAARLHLIDIAVNSLHPEPE